MEFSPDGRQILTGCLDSTARLWDAATGRSVTLDGVLRHSSRVLHASFHPDGHRIVTTCLDGTSRMWDLAASARTPAPSRAVFSPAGTEFLVQSNGCLLVIETKTNRPLKKIELAAPLKEARWNRNCHFLLILSSTNQRDREAPMELAVWEKGTGRRIFSLPSFTGTLKQVALSDDGQHMVYCRGNEAKVYDLRSTPAAVQILPHRKVIQRSLFSRNGQQLLTICHNEINLWTLDPRECRFTKNHSTDVSSAQFSEDGNLLVTACADETLTECWAQVWDVATGEALGPRLTHRDGVLSATFSPNADRVVTASEDSTALIWDRVKGGEPKKLQHDYQVHDACFNPGGSWVLTVSRDKSARLWDAESGEPVSPPLPHPASLWHGVFLDDNSFLTSDDKGNTWIWQITADSRPVEDLMDIGEILNPKRPSVSSSGAIAERAYAIWRKMKEKYPAQFAVNRSELVAWHRHQAGLSVEEGNWPAALFHYDSLLTLEPEDREVIQLRNQAADQLQR